MTEIIQSPTQQAPREELLERAMARHHYSGDALIEILHNAQELYGYLSPPLLSRIARGLKLPPSRVLGVATFYHLFRFEPRKAHCAVVCLGTACYGAGARDLLARAHCEKADAWTIEVGRCVGSCGLAPVVIVDGVPKSRMTPAGLESLLSI
jgi:bidirectional [NiFe] hydrogenase diaphorase subunit